MRTAVGVVLLLALAGVASVPVEPRRVSEEEFDKAMDRIAAAQGDVLRRQQEYGNALVAFNITINEVDRRLAEIGDAQQAAIRATLEYLKLHAKTEGRQFAESVTAFTALEQAILLGALSQVIS